MRHLMVRDVEEMPGHGRVTRGDRGHGQQQQGGGHDDRGLPRVLRVARARAPHEHDEEEPEHVERGEQGGAGGDPEDGGVAAVGVGDDQVLAEISAEARAADERERAGHEAEGGERHAAEESAHFPDILLVVQGDDDRPRAEEEEAFEERVGEKVEDGDIVDRRDGDADDHVAELRDRRIGEDALDVVLLRGHEAGGEAGDRADPHDDFAHGFRRGEEDGEDARQHVDAGGDHGGGMEQRGDRCRAFHRVRQPDVQRHLGRLADCAAENKEAGGGEVARMQRNRGQVLLDPGEHDRPGGQPEHEDAEQEAEVAHAVDEKGLFAGVGGGILAEVVADEDVGADPDQLPEDIHHHEIVGQDDAQHGEKEEAEGGVVARDALVAAHVAGGVDEDERGDRRHHDEHHPAELVKHEADGDGKNAGNLQPGDRRGDGQAGREEKFPAQAASEHGGGDGDPHGARGPARQQEQDRAGRDERGEEEDPGLELRVHRGVRISSG